jgi:Na+/melibiose symporter-like transporter
MSNKILKILWVVIIFLFLALQAYNLIQSNYADVVTGLLTVVIILALIIAYWLIARTVKEKKVKNKESEENINNKSEI